MNAVNNEGREPTMNANLDIMTIGLNDWLSTILTIFWGT
jgi:hypothetical protein